MTTTRRCVALVFIACLLTGPSHAWAQVSSGTPSTVVAEQGGVTVTLSDVDAFAKGIPEKERPGFFNSPMRIESTITTLLLQKQLAAEARKSGLDRDPSSQPQIDFAMNEALSKIRIDKLKADLRIPDFTALAKEEYIGHKEKYVIPGKLDVKHILISTKSRSDDEAKALAETVEKEAKAHPDQFDALVEKYSEDPSKAANHGVMTEAGSNRYTPAFADAAKALKNVGDISPVVKTQYGYHILKLTARTPDVQQKFEDVRAQIVERLRTDYIDKAVRTHTDEIRNRPLTANKDLVASLRSRYGEAPAPPLAMPSPSDAAQKAGH